jgi:phage shock protein E
MQTLVSFGSAFTAVVVVALTGCAGAPVPTAATSPVAATETAPATSSDQVDGPAAHKLVQDGAALVDVRSPDEYAKKHIDGAINVPVDEVTSHDFGGKDKPLVVYCMHGQRSAKAVEALRGAGYTHVFLLGAMSSWGQ